MTGKGKYIDVSILETILADQENQITWWSFAKAKGTRMNARNLPVYPWGAFPTNDGYISIQGVGRGEAWMPRLYAMMGMPELAEDPRFSTPQARLQNSDEFNALLYSWLVDHSKQEIFDAADTYRYPMAPVYTTEEIMNSPHHRERGFFIEIDHPQAGKLTYPGAPFIMSQGGFSVRRPAPLLGEHNEEIYCGLLGYSRGDLSVLRKLNSI
jgi:crotonobetainyl-CoA:carnitine CoA-transferase CaiB-like acyl-CoA transferase